MKEHLGDGEDHTAVRGLEPAERVRKEINNENKDWRSLFCARLFVLLVLRTARVCVVLARCALWGRQRAARGVRRAAACDVLGVVQVPCNIRREGGSSLVILEGKEGHPL